MARDEKEERGAKLSSASRARFGESAEASSRSAEASCDPVWDALPHAVALHALSSPVATKQHLQHRRGWVSRGEDQEREPAATADSVGNGTFWAAKHDAQLSQ